MRYTDDVVANVKASDETFEPLRAGLSLQELQELTITIGFYMAVSRYLETFGVDIEEPGGDGIDIARRPTERRATRDAPAGRVAGAAPGVAAWRAADPRRRRRAERFGLEDPPIGNGRAMALLFARGGRARGRRRPRRGEHGRDGAPASPTTAARRSASSADVTDPARVAAMVATAAERLDGLDGVVYNVGVGEGSGWPARRPRAGTACSPSTSAAPCSPPRPRCPCSTTGASIVFISSVAGLQARQPHPVLRRVQGGAGRADAPRRAGGRARGRSGPTSSRPG